MRLIGVALDYLFDCHSVLDFPQSIVRVSNLALENAPSINATGCELFHAWGVYTSVPHPKHQKFSLLFLISVSVKAE